jgi:hypothetical protein
MKEVKDATDRKEREAEVFFEYQSSSISHTPPPSFLFLLLFSLFFFPHFSLPFKTLNPKI